MYTSVDTAEMDAGRGAHPASSPYEKAVGDALDIQSFGIYQVELPPGGETVPHDHVADRAEDVYAVIRGTGTVVVDDQEVSVTPGQYVGVTPESVRYARAGDDGLVFIAVCAVSAESPSI
jgi:uncharacterized cupin superfamily protein